MPSSCTVWQSAAQTTPPMSAAWATLPLKATILPSWKTGATMTMSGRWPVPIQGSLVMTMSPGCQVSRGKQRSRSFMQGERQPTKAGDAAPVLGDQVAVHVQYHGDAVPALPDDGGESGADQAGDGLVARWPGAGSSRSPG